MSRKKQLIFQPAEILLPAGDLRRWSVIACDQYSSDGEYWEEVERFVGRSPSSLRLMLPEYYLGRCDEEQETLQICSAMRRYLASDVFRACPDSLIYVERQVSGRRVRRGLVGVIDLEAYDYSECSKAPIRASEHTVEDRLPPRVKVRREAMLEMPHIMLFFHDAKDDLMRLAEAMAGETLYDFDLMGGGGHIRGKRIHGGDAWDLCEKISAGDGFRFAVGDGNHSLAAARKCWMEEKRGLSPAERARHPARFALVELVNIHDPAVSFQPIHRVLFRTDPTCWFPLAEDHLQASDGREVTLLCGDACRQLRVKGDTIGEVIEHAEAFCRWYTEQYGGTIDYIHGNDEAAFLSRQEGSCGMLLPMMQKDELFASVEKAGPFPKKSFSIGHGADKRYYLECRKIK